MNNISRLNECVLFKDMNETELSSLLRSCSTKTYKKGQILQTGGTTLSSLFVILEGSIEISNVDFNGNKKMVAILETNDVFGESVALSTNQITPLNITSLSTLEVLIITKEAFEACTSKTLFLNMIQILSNKNVFLTHKIECLNKTTIKERVYEVLKYYYYLKKSLHIELPYNRTQLSEYLCVNRSSLTREMKKMQQEGYFINEKQKYLLNKSYFN